MQNKNNKREIVYSIVCGISRQSEKGLILVNFLHINLIKGFRFGKK